MPDSKNEIWIWKFTDEDGNTRNVWSETKPSFHKNVSSLKYIRADLAAPDAGKAGVDDAWQPAHTVAPKGLHTNPDAKVWAAYFVEVFPGHKHMQDLMHGWFSNAMMAMHDYLLNKPHPAPATDEAFHTIAQRLNVLERYIDYDRITKERGVMNDDAMHIRNCVKDIRTCLDHIAAL